MRKSRVVFIGCLNPKIDEDILREKFGEVGKIEHIEIARNEDGKSKQFGYITYETPEEAEAAIIKFHDTIFYDKVLNVERYRRRKKGDDFDKLNNYEHHRRSSFSKRKDDENKRKHHHHHHHKHHSKK